METAGPEASDRSTRSSIRCAVHHGGAGVRNTAAHRLPRGLNCLLALAAIALSACAHAPLERHADAKAWQSLPVTVSSESVVMTLWAVPSSDKSIKLQVRLSPRTHIKTAWLEATAPDLTIAPARFELRNLDRASTARDPHSPPNPPALGRTYTYTFRIKAPAPGTYHMHVMLAVPNMRQVSVAITVRI